MYRYKKLLIHLNLNEQDKTLIQYAGLISKMARSEQVYFVHVASSFDMPESLKKEYPQIVEPLDEYAQKTIEGDVNSFFSRELKTQKNHLVVQGNTLEHLLRYIKQKDIDLVIVGRDNINDSQLAEKLARKAPCSVLILPKNCKPQINKVFAGIDFSDYSLDTIDVATAFAVASKLESIVGVHVYQVPIGYYKTGKSYEEFAEIMRKNAETEFNNFLAKADLKGVSVRPTLKLGQPCRNTI